MSLPNAPQIYDRIHVIPNPDGSLTRPVEFFPTVPPSTSDPTLPAVSKDVPINSEKNTWVRIFLPSETLNFAELPPRKLPVLIYVHGGGFISLSPDLPSFHEFCAIAAGKLAAMVVSVKYRLAPEHRLPAAYDDVLEALTWVKDGEDEWVKKYGDLSNCILMGESAGGNITYHVGLRLADRISEYKPMIFKGLVLIQPFFGGLDPSGSEVRLANDTMVSIDLCELLWDLSLPVGADRSHEYCDVISDVRSGSLMDRVRDLGWWVAVVGCDGDPLYDRNVELAKLFEKKGVIMRTLFTEGGQHGMFVNGPIKRIEFLDFVNEFWP